MLFEQKCGQARMVASMVEFHLGLEELPCPSATKEDFELLLRRYAQLTDAKNYLVSTIVFHPQTRAASRSYTVRAKVTVDSEELFFSHAKSASLEDAVTRTILGLTNQLRHRLFFFQWQSEQDVVPA